MNAEWQAIMIPTSCRSEGAPLAAVRRGCGPASWQPLDGCLSLEGHPGGTLAIGGCP